MAGFEHKLVIFGLKYSKKPPVWVVFYDFYRFDSWSNLRLCRLFYSLCVQKSNIQHWYKLYILLFIYNSDARYNLCCNSIPIIKRQLAIQVPKFYTINSWIFRFVFALRNNFQKRHLWLFLIIHSANFIHNNDNPNGL